MDLRESRLRITVNQLPGAVSPVDEEVQGGGRGGGVAVGEGGGRGDPAP